MANVRANVRSVVRTSVRCEKCSEIAAHAIREERVAGRHDTCLVLYTRVEVMREREMLCILLRSTVDVCPRV